MTAERKALVAPARVHASAKSFDTARSRVAHHDPRWSRIEAALADLHERGRRAVRIVDADCACGTLLIEATRHARSLGFTAIEGRGIDGSPSLIGRARAAAARHVDPAVGLTFDLADMTEGLAEEADFPADIVLWHGDRPDDQYAGIPGVIAAAGDLVIGDPLPSAGRDHAA